MVSRVAECHSQSGSASQSTVSHGGPNSRPANRREKYSSSTTAKCLRSPPNVIEEAPTVALIPASSTPAHFHSKMARWRSREPNKVADSLPAMGVPGDRPR